MFYPTGKTTGGRIIVCKCCNEDEMAPIKSNDTIALHELNKWLDENNYCMETWQVKEYLNEMGIASEEVNETMNEYEEEVRFRFLNKSAEESFEGSDLYSMADLNEEGDFVADKKTFNAISTYLQQEGYNSSDYEVLVGEDSASAAAPGAPAAGYATVATVQGMGDVVSPTNTGTNASFYDPSAVGSGDRLDARGMYKLPKGKKDKPKKYLAIKNFDDFIATMKKMQ